ncbi:hypothetical protein FACS1894188_05610 [Clostridia bacterium]|nr:hypothetical protein FACS1894188_05610 [Clostridia bacterium]
MTDIYLTHLDEKDKEKFVFWSSGNFPTQKSKLLNFEDVEVNFKALYLLSDKIIASSSYYYESEITRQITSSYKDIFGNGDVLYCIDETIENFTEHGLNKIKKSPKDMIAYLDKSLVKERGKTLDEIGHILRRKPDSISQKIKYLWAEDIYSDDDFSIKRYLKNNIYDSHERDALAMSLSNISTYNKGIDFVWEYVEPLLDELKRIPTDFKKFMRKRLTELYIIANADILGVRIDDTLKGLTSRFDTNLFLQCMESLGIKAELSKLSEDSLITLKTREEFKYFKEQYFKFVQAVNYDEAISKESFKLLPEILRNYESYKLDNQGGIIKNNHVTKKAFVSAYFSKRKNLKPYKNPIDTLLNVYDDICNDPSLVESSSILLNLPILVGISSGLGEVSKENETSGYISNVDRRKPMNLHSPKDSDSIDLLIIVALEEEREAIIKRFATRACNALVKYGAREFDFECKSGIARGVVIESGLGNIPAAIATSEGVTKFHPKAVILTGIAAAFKDDSKMLGDILVAEYVVGYDNGKVVAINKTQRNYPTHPASYALLQAAKKLHHREWIAEANVRRPDGPRINPVVHFGYVLSGDKVVKDADFMNELKEGCSKAMGLEMEGYGVASAIRQVGYPVQFLLIKSVCDFGNEDKDDSWHSYCCDIASAFVAGLAHSLSFAETEPYKPDSETEPFKPNSKSQKYPILNGAALVKINRRLNKDELYDLKTIIEVPHNIDATKVVNIYNWLKGIMKTDKFVEALRGIEREDIIDEFFKRGV